MVLADKEAFNRARFESAINAERARKQPYKIPADIKEKWDKLTIAEKIRICNQATEAAK